MLLHKLQVAATKFTLCDTSAGTTALEDFLCVVRDLVQPHDPALAELLVGAAGVIKDVATGSDSDQDRPAFCECTRQANGKMKLRFHGPRHRTYFVEASTNLVHWEVIGLAQAQTDGSFRFDDPWASIHPTRYYRVRCP